MSLQAQLCSRSADELEQLARRLRQSVTGPAKGLDETIASVVLRLDGLHHRLSLAGSCSREVDEPRPDL